MLAVTINAVICLALTGYTVYILDAFAQKYFKEYSELDEDMRPSSEPLKRLPVRTGIGLFIGSILFGVIPVSMHWSFIVPAVAIVALQILLFSAISYKEHRLACTSYSLQFAGAIAFCIGGEPFELVTYAFIAFAPVFVCGCIADAQIKKGGDRDE